MRIDVVSLFPEFVAQCAAFGVVGRAVERGLLSIHGTNPRDFAEGNYRRVDDRPFGGGPGMVMLIDPLRRALDAARGAAEGPARVVYMTSSSAWSALESSRPASRSGRRSAVRPSACIRRQRAIRAEVDEEISIGDYVLSGGELAAAVVIDAIARLQEGALNDAESAVQDSFEDGLLDCPHYTRPVEHPLGTVPDVLLSGDHARIARWRRMQALGRTAERRPDLLAGRELSRADQALLDEYRRLAQDED
jgi:tRNA (guanine37-N1)-methyltransferase